MFDKIARKTLFLLQKALERIVYFFNLSWKKKLLYTSLAGIGLLLLCVLLWIGFYYAVASGVFGAIPSDDELKSVKNYQASEVYSSDGVLLGRFFVENRTDIPYEKIDTTIIQALIATEDERFYAHEGVDTRSLMRVIFKSVILGKKAGGGSTISQQLIKNMFGRQRHGFLTMPVVKAKEAILANKLEHLYTKKEILNLYLNTVSFGEDTYGVETACERFFNKTAMEVSVEEAAVLIGMLKAPTTYNPRKNPEVSRLRRNVVLAQMAKNGYLTLEDFEELKEKPIELDYNRLVDHEGSAPFFREQLRKKTEEWLQDIKKEDGTSYDLYKDGLRIHTTIHSQLQKYAERAVLSHLKHLQPQLRQDLSENKFFSEKKDLLLASLKKTQRYKAAAEKGLDNDKILKLLKEPVQTTLYTLNGVKDTSISPLDSVVYSLSQLQAGFLAINPKNGHILSWVGGTSYQNEQYDHVRSTRQVGSVFKPIVYAMALKEGKKPCDFIPNQKITYTAYDDWTPKNSDGNYEGKYSVIGALTKSVNTISVKLCMEAGVKNVISFAHELGIKDSLPHGPSIALGTANISLLDMVEAYTAFANNGKRTHPVYVTKIENDAGEAIYQQETEHDEVLDEKYADQITAMLESVVNKGTASRLRHQYRFKGEIAGKTGTTQHHADGWFIGYTPHWLAGVWVGANNPAVRFSSIRDGQGANMALPIWANFYKSIDRDKENYRINSGSFDHGLQYDCEFYEEYSKFRQLFRRKEKKNTREGIEKKKKRFLIF